MKAKLVRVVSQKMWIQNLTQTERRESREKVDDQLQKSIMKKWMMQLIQTQILERIQRGNQERAARLRVRAILVAKKKEIGLS